MKKNKPERDINAIKTSIGGQALMEGIMMRGPKVTAMAVRNKDGEIVVEKSPTFKKKRAEITRVPFFRGIFNFVDSMKVGYKYLMRSAEISGLEEAEAEIEREKAEKKHLKKLKKQGITEESDETVFAAEINSTCNESIITEEATTVVTDENGKTDADNTKTNDKEKGSSALTVGVMIIGVVLGIALAVGLFVIIPSYLYKWISGLLPGMAPADNPVLRSLFKSLFETVLKLAMLVGYMALISLMKDIRRVFQFHGAEHKTIFCYEHGLELNVENVRKQRRFHPRCGTSFLILMLLVSFLISFAIDPLYILITGSEPATYIRIIIKLCLIPLIVGIGYELIKAAGKHDNILTKIISAPGLWLQRLTVFEPDDSMIECAITAIKEVIPDDGSDRI